MKNLFKQLLSNPLHYITLLLQFAHYKVDKRTPLHIWGGRGIGLAIVVTFLVWPGWCDTVLGMYLVIVVTAWVIAAFWEALRDIFKGSGVDMGDMFATAFGANEVAILWILYTLFI